jgi:putative membrane protein
MSEDTRSADRRTKLAVERTYLAWWRTGLTAFAVALATARVVPELSKSKTQWPYTILGIGFALMGAALMYAGEQRRRYGESEEPSRTLTVAFTAGGLLLGAGVIVLLAIEP